MIRILFFLFFFSYSSALLSQKFDWAEQIGSAATSNLEVTAIAAYDNDTVAIGIVLEDTLIENTGTIYSNGGRDILFRLMAPNQAVINTLQFSSTGSRDNLTDAINDNSSTYVTGKLAGYSSVASTSGTINNTYGNGSFFLAKINNAGLAEWLVPSVNEEVGTGEALTVDLSGNIYVAGTYEDSLIIGTRKIISKGLNDVFLAKYNSSGVIQWLVSYGGVGGDEVVSIKYENTSQNVIMCGNFNQPISTVSGALTPNTLGEYDVFLASFSSNTGNLISSKQSYYSPGSGDVKASDMVIDQNLNLVIGGGFTTSVAPTTQTSIVETSSGGEDIFIGLTSLNFLTQSNLKTYGGLSNERITKLVKDSVEIFTYGEFSSNISFGTQTVSTRSSQDVFMAVFGPTNNELSALGGIMTFSSDRISASAIDVSKNKVYYGGEFKGKVNFDKVGSLISLSRYYDGYLSVAEKKDVLCSIDDSVIISSDFRVQMDTALLCFNDSGMLTPNVTGNNYTYNWYNSTAPNTSIGTRKAIKIKNTGTYYAVIEEQTKLCSTQSINTIVKVEDEPFNEIKDTIVCAGTGPFTIPTYPSYYFTYGNLTGSNGADPSTGRFFSAISGIGKDTIVYTYTDLDGCRGQDSAIFEVQANPVINFSTLPQYCEGDLEDTLKYASTSLPVKTSYYSMVNTYGIEDSVIFRVDTLLPNVFPGHAITYHAIDLIGCSSSRSANIIVNPTPNVSFSFSPPIPFCANTPPFVISGGNQLKGVYFGNAVNSTSKLFTPSSVIGTIDSIKFAYTDKHNCSDTAKFDIILDTVPIVSVSTISPVCASEDLVKLEIGMPNSKGIGKYTSSWVSSNNFYPQFSGVGTHQVTYSFEDQRGCEDSVNFNVEIIPLPIVTLSSISALCENDATVTLTEGSPTGGKYSVRGIDLVNDMLNPQTLSPLPNGEEDSVFYAYTDTNNCTAIAKTKLTIKRLDEIIFSPRLELDRICVYDSINILELGELQFSPPPSTGGRILDEYDNNITVFKGVNYLSITSDTIKKSELKYIYDYSNIGCSDTATTFINIAPQPKAAISSINTVCINTNFELTAEGEGTYIWGNKKTDKTITVTQTKKSNYYVTVSSALECTDSASKEVSMSNKSSVKSKDITQKLTKEGVTVDVLSYYSNDEIDIIASILFLNEPKFSEEILIEEGIKKGIASSYYYKPMPIIRIKEEINYSVCDITCPLKCDTSKLILSVLGNPYEFIPNGFSPNNDGINDTWVVPGIERYPSNELFIYNRWGDLIYKAAPYNNDWEGQATEGILSSKKVGDGVFFYVLITNNGDPIRGTIEMKSK